jgi:hypothetical protein
MSEEQRALCDCLICSMTRQADAEARAASEARARTRAAGPKEPREDDDDDDDDGDSDHAATPSDGLCECAQCRPSPVATGEKLLTLLRQCSDSLIKNYDEAGDYGSRLTNGLAALPLPPDAEDVLLQYAVDNWNAADRAAIAMCAVITKYDPALQDKDKPTGDPKTLDDARGLLARMREGRPRVKGQNAKHNLEEQIRAAAELIFGRGRVGVSVHHIKL